MDEARQKLAASIAARFYPKILGRARRLLHDEDEARDIAQEVLLRVLVTPGLSAFHQHPLVWLSRVTRNLCLNRVRAQTTHSRLLADLELLPAAPDSPERAVLTREAVASVPPALRKIANYYFLEELSHAEIAARLGVSRRSVGNRLAKLRR
jgi:RNA polymerase sigma factor (sigma-70 family)